VNQAQSSLVTHCGARVVSREELDRIDAPPPTRTWFPVRHSAVIDTVGRTLEQAGFRVNRVRHAVTRGDARMFATMDLSDALADGVTLAVGIRNSTDKSLPLGFCAGSRVFVCDNLAFRSELLVRRKHTRFGQERFEGEIASAVRSLEQFRAAESLRIARMRSIAIGDELAESLILRGQLAGIISPRVLPKVVTGWREPEFEEFRPRTLWSLFNAFTSALAPRLRSNPQQFATLTMRVSELLHPVPGTDGAFALPPRAGAGHDDAVMDREREAAGASPLRAVELSRQ
jgi:hypothetical protein